MNWYEEYLIVGGVVFAILAIVRAGDSITKAIYALIEELEKHRS